MNLPYKLDSGFYRTKDGQGSFYCIIWVTTTYDSFYTLLFSAHLVENIKIPNNYPRFITVENAEKYWNKIKHKFK